MNRQLRRLLAGLLALSIASASHAGLITQPTDRARIAAHLDREEVAAELASQGITREQANARVAALTDAEAAGLAGRIDELPAGGFVQVIGAMGIAIAAIPVLIGVAVFGVVLLAVGTVSGIKYMAKHGDTKGQQAAAETSVAQPELAQRQVKWNAASLRPDPHAASPFPASGWFPVRSAAPYHQVQASVPAASPFPVSTGLYGSFVPAIAQATPAQAKAE